MVFSGHFFASDASGLGLHKARGARIKARVLGDGDAVVFVDQQFLIKRNRGLDCFPFIRLPGASFDGGFSIEEPDLPTGTGRHEIDLQLVGAALDGFERIRRYGTR